MAFQREEGAVVIDMDDYGPEAQVNAQYPQAAYDPDPELLEPETGEDESMEDDFYHDEPAEDSTATTITAGAKPAPTAKRRQGVSRMLAEAVANNPGLTQSEYQRALGISSPIATMAKRLVERGIIAAKQDGRYVRYYPGKREFTEAQVGRKPGRKAVPTQTAKKQKPESHQPQGWNIVSITYDDGTTKRYVRLDREWYELVKSSAPQV